MALARKRRVSTAILARQTVLALGTLIAVPLLFYPKQFGLPSLELSPVFSLVEWAFYFGVFAIVGSELPASTRVVTAGLTVVSRLVVGLLLGSFLSWTHMKPWTATVVSVMWSYPLALVLHVLIIPIALKPVWEHLLSGSPRHLKHTRRHVALSRSTGTRIVRQFHGSRTVATTPSVSAAALSSGAGSATRELSLDDAVSYVGEYHGVRMCWIVDSEGLPLAVWQRQHYSADADFWSPVTIEAVDFHRQRLSVAGECKPERLEVKTDQGRLIAEAVGEFWLGVLTDPDADDLIGVRLSRAREMMANYLQETERRFAGTGEAHYV